MPPIQLTQQGVFTMSQKFYELSHNLDRFELDNLHEFGDGYLKTKFNNWEYIRLAFWTAIPISLEGDEGLIIRRQSVNGNGYICGAKMPLEIILAWGDKDNLDNPIDYPYLPSARSWPIMSRRMLDVLLSVESFSHQVIPVIFTHIDGLVPSGEERHDFIILQLLEHFDGLDRDRTEYSNTFDESDPELEIIDFTGEMVLKEPSNGFPPIFRVKEDGVSLYVSAAAKEALEKAGIQGLDFSSWNIGSS
jgi:hypothetical protein